MGFRPIGCMCNLFVKKFNQHLAGNALLNKREVNGSPSSKLGQIRFQLSNWNNRPHMWPWFIFFLFNCLFLFLLQSIWKKIFFNYLHGAHLSASLCFNFLFWKLNFWNIDIYAWLGLPMAGKIVFAAPSRPLVMQQIEACHNIVGIPQVRCSLQSSMWWYAQFFAS